MARRFGAGRGARRGARADQRHALGRAGEAAAQAYLQGLGYQIVARNYRCRGGEIDLVATDGSALVFVEVKTRTGKAYGSALEAVDGRKQRRIAAAAVHFLATHRCAGLPARFDVIAVLPRDGDQEIEHLRNAFELG